MVGSTLPPSAGLSSSSALVCCAAVCTLRANTGQDFDKVNRVCAFPIFISVPVITLGHLIEEAHNLIGNGNLEKL